MNRINISKLILIPATLLGIAFAAAGCRHEHSVVIDAAREATCMEHSLTEGSHCSVCGEILVAQVEGDTYGPHAFGEAEVKTQSTCLEAGLGIATCKICGTTENVEIEALGHEVSEWQTIEEATCTEDGLERGECARENKTVTRVIEATGHSLGEWQKIQEPTYTASGRERRICNFCDYAEFRDIDALEANFLIVIHYGDGRADSEIAIDSDGAYELTAPERVGYAFSGFVDKSGNRVSLSGTLTENSEFFATWEILPTATFTELSERAAAGVDRILLASDITITESIYIVSDTTIFCNTDVKLLRSPDFEGDLFVIGEDKNGRNILLDGNCAALTLRPEESAALVIDGNKDKMNVTVIGTAFFVVNSGTLNMYDGVTIRNCIKEGNGRLFENSHFISNVTQVGGAAAIVIDSTFNMYGGTITSNTVNQNDKSDADATDDAEYYASSCGGAIYGYGSINIYGGTFSNNEAGRGGAIYSYKITRINAGVFDSNTATYGGAIYLVSSQYVNLVIGKEGAHQNTVVFSNNTARSHGGAIRGQFYNGILIYGGTMFVGNTASSGGAISTPGALVAHNTLFISNSVTTSGGAIYASFSDAGTVRDIILYDCEFEGNRAGHGGAISFSASNTEGPGSNGFIYNCLFKENYAIMEGTEFDSAAAKSGYNGGALYLTRYSTVVLEDVRFTHNGAVYNGGAVYAASGSVLTMSGAKFYSNRAVNNAGGIYADGSTLNLSDVIFGNTSRGNSATKGGAMYINNNCDVTIADAQFKCNESSNNGGAVETHGSKLRLLGEKNLFSDNSSGAGGGAIYISYNSAGPLYSEVEITNTDFRNNSAATGGAIYASQNSELSLSNCYLDLNKATGQGGAIYLSQCNISSLGHTEFHMNSANQGGAMYMTAGCEVSGTEVVFYANTAKGNGGAIEIHGSVFTLDGSRSMFMSNTAGSNGGAMYISYNSDGPRYSTVRMENIRFELNSAENGGALNLSSSSTVSLVSCSFLANNAKLGGAIYSAGSTLSSIEDSKFDSNSSTSNGGAIYLSTSEISSLKGSEFNKNTASGGGALYVVESTATISDSEFISNKASSNGGALYIYTSSTVNLRDNTRFDSNTSSNYGGVAYVSGGATLNIYDATATNSSAKRGGMIYLTTGGDTTNVYIYKLTSTGNTAADGDEYGSCIWSNSSKAVLHVRTSGFDFEGTLMNSSGNLTYQELPEEEI